MDPCRIPRITRTIRTIRTIRVPRARSTHLAPPPVSATLGTLPAGVALRAYTLPDLEHYLVVINERYADDPERLEAAYRALQHPARPHVWDMFATPDPETDLVGYLEARWWAELDAVTLALILRMERAGLSYPWPHGRTAGPVLTPSR